MQPAGIRSHTTGAPNPTGGIYSEVPFASQNEQRDLDTLRGSLVRAQCRPLDSAVRNSCTLSGNALRIRTRTFPGGEPAFSTRDRAVKMRV